MRRATVGMVGLSEGGECCIVCEAARLSGMHNGRPTARIDKETPVIRLARIVALAALSAAAFSPAVHAADYPVR
ncbi:MAG: hypothetical protein ACHP83_06705, partial [Burkholderiales bacterium]